MVSCKCAKSQALNSNRSNAALGGPLSVVSEQEPPALTFSNMDVIDVGVSLQCEDQTNDVSSWQESGHRVHQRPDDTDKDEKQDKNNQAEFTLSSSPTSK